MPRHKKGTSDNTGAYALAGVGSLLLLAAIASGSKKDTAEGDDAKKQVQTEPGTPSAQAIKEASEFIKKVGGENAETVTGDQMRKAFEGRPIPEVLGFLNRYPGNTTYNATELAGNVTTTNKGFAEVQIDNTATGAKGNKPPTVGPPHGDKNAASAFPIYYHRKLFTQTGTGGSS